MADQYGLFWNSVSGDRTYDADSFSEWLGKFFTTGVFNGDLQVTPDSGMVVNVGSGYANINGKVRFFDTDTSITISPASGVYPRIDTIVVRADYTNREITLEYVTGSYSGNDPQPTAPTRNASMYEIVLAQILVSAGSTEVTARSITDTRPDSTVCGWVTGTVDSVAVDQLTAQAQAQFEVWFDHMKGQLSEDAAGNLQLQIDALDTRIDGIDTAIGDTDISAIGDGTLTGAADSINNGLNTSVSRIRSVATLLTQCLISTSNTKYTLSESVSNFALIAVVCGWGIGNVLDTVVMPSAVWSSNKTDAMRLWVNRQTSANIYVDVKSRTATTLYCQSSNSNVSVGVYGILRVN